ncbi:MAG TPA: YbaK/EbsC family protein [Candidatus Acidoferrum sp.]|nr:YbaK/EbsC family protein [Candidatus Acidoferrum sp.]
MRRARAEVLLLGECESTASSLFQFMESHGCHCSFASPTTTHNSHDLRAFDLILSTAPLKQDDPLVLMLDGSKCRVFYRFPVEDGCWWIPLDGEARKRLGGAAARSEEFVRLVEEIVRDIQTGRASATEEFHGGTNAMMPERLKSILDHEHVAYSPVSHAPAYSAQYAAAVMHVHGKDVAKTVVLRAGKDIVLAVLPASHRINLEKMASAVHSRVELVEEEECRRLFPDCEAGVFPAFGELYGLPVYMDEALAEDPDIIFSAGTRSEAIHLSNADFVRLVKPRICSFAERSRSEKEVA